MKSLYALLILAQMTGLPFCMQAQNITPELFAPGIISGPVDDAAPVFTPDGKTVYFFRSSSSMGCFIFVSHWKNGEWSNPVIAPFSGQWQDLEPAIAPDGSYMIFSSNRPATPGGHSLNGVWNSQHHAGGGGNFWRIDRKGDSWGEPYRLPDIINSDSSIFSPAVAADGTLYFMKPVADTGHFHLYCSTYRNGQYQQPVPVSFSAPDSISDVDPAVAADGSFLVFSSGRSKIKGQLFIVFRENGQWGTPVNMGQEVNRSTFNNEAKLSPDNRRLYFSTTYAPATTYPVDPATIKCKLAACDWDTRASNIWSVPLDQWLQNR